MFLCKCSLTLLVLFHLFPSIYGLYRGKMMTTPIPYMAAVKEDIPHGYYLCSGAIIASHWVLSHTSCVLKLRGRVVVVAGTINVDYPGITVGIKDVIIHEDYDPEADIKNIALIQTLKRIVPKNETKPATKPATKLVTKAVNIVTKAWSAESDCKFHGFGVASYLENSVEKRNVTHGILHEGTTDALTQTGDCGCLADKITPIQRKDYVCNLAGTGRICVGDFGGPIVCGKGQTEVVVAVAHNFIPCEGYDVYNDYYVNRKGTACDDEKTTDIFTYLFPYQEWIESTIKSRSHITISHSYANCLPLISRWLLISTVCYTFYNI